MAHCPRRRRLVDLRPPQGGCASVDDRRPGAIALELNVLLVETDLLDAERRETIRSGFRDDEDEEGDRGEERQRPGPKAKEVDLHRHALVAVGRS